jgi:hypothetical protein
MDGLPPFSLFDAIIIECGRFWIKERGMGEGLENGEEQK